jgi:hypothetical protein
MHNHQGQRVVGRMDRCTLGRQSGKSKPQQKWFRNGVKLKHVPESLLLNSERDV